jgi:hypothetical protein
MSQRIPSGAFEYYVSLGAERSYRAVARYCGVSKRAITKHAAVECWPARLAELEREAKKRSDQVLVETLQEMRTRHLKTLRAMSARALSGLKEFPLTSGMEAIRAAELTIKLERLVAGESTENKHLSLEEITRREIENLLVAEDDEADGEDVAAG